MCEGNRVSGKKLHSQLAHAAQDQSRTSHTHVVNADTLMMIECYHLGSIIKYVFEYKM